MSVVMVSLMSLIFGFVSLSLLHKGLIEIQGLTWRTVFEMGAAMVHLR